MEYMIREYPGASLSQIFPKGRYLKLYLLVGMTAVEWKGPQERW